jgi:hypothetical protein
MKKVEVRYVAFPATKEGIIAFYQERTSKKCTEPSIEYKSGRCQINNPEDMNSIATKVDAMTREQFKAFRLMQGETLWLDAYSEYLSKQLGIALQTESGIEMTIDGEEVRFYCQPGEFAPWEKKRK